jgi:hypothetical protein
MFFHPVNPVHPVLHFFAEAQVKPSRTQSNRSNPVSFVPFVASVALSRTQSNQVKPGQTAPSERIPHNSVAHCAGLWLYWPFIVDETA